MTGDASRDERKALRRKEHAAVPEKDEPVLPSVPRDETSEGWGDESDARDDEWYRRERPPHHGD